MFNPAFEIGESMKMEAPEVMPAGSTIQEYSPRSKEFFGIPSLFWRKDYELNQENSINQ